MVLVSKSIATNKKGGVKKGYKVVETKNGRMMYFTDDKKKVDVKDKPKEKKEKKEKEKNELIVDFE